MSIIVQKFGGTSLAEESSRDEACSRVAEAIGKGYSPVVVVSAIGRHGAPYATDTLKELALNSCPDSQSRELDMVMSCGEIISAVVMANSLRSRGIKARALTGGQAGMITNGVYGGAEVITLKKENLLQVLEAGQVAVVAGFQGMDINGEINTLGRGGSDTTAVILGSGLAAKKVEIYTDVNGIMTADPKICPEARTLDKVTYNELCQMAYEGAKVMHPQAVEVAMQNEVPLVIKNLFEKDAGSSVVTAVPETLIKETAGGCFTRGRRVVTAIAHATDLIQIQVEVGKEDADRELEVFEKIAASRINIDLINVFPNLKVFTIEKERQSRTEQILKKMGVTYSMQVDCVKVSVVGIGMRNIPGVMAKVVKALHNQHIRILQTGDSNITISLLLDKKDLTGAIRTLHAHFDLGIPVSRRDEKILA